MSGKPGFPDSNQGLSIPFQPSEPGRNIRFKGERLIYIGKSPLESCVRFQQRSQRFSE